MRKKIAIALFMSCLMLFGACSNLVPRPTPSGDPPATTQPDPTEDPKIETLFNELTRSLASGAYADDTLYSESYGLSAPESVGVDKDRFENEVLYPVAPDAQFEAGCIFSVGAADGDEGLYAAMQEALVQNKLGKRVKIKLPPKETIRLKLENFADTTHVLTFEDFDGLDIEGEDTLLLVESASVYDYKGAIRFENCKNVRMQGVNIDYAKPTSFTGIVVSSNLAQKTITFSVPAEFNELLEGVSDLTVKTYVEYDQNTGTPRDNGNYLYYDAIESAAVASTPGGKTVTIRFTVAITQPPVGTPASIATIMRGQNAILVNLSENMYFETVSIFNSAGMGFVTTRAHNLYLNRVNIMLNPDSVRKQTTAADAMHFMHCTGDAFITNCLVENSHDDALNIKCGYYSRITGIDLMTNKITTEVTQPDSVPPEVGGTVEIRDADLNLVSEAVVEGITYSGQMVMKLKGNLFKLETGMYVSDVSCSPKFLYNNNIVRNKRNRGLLVQVRKGEVSNNAFMGIVHGALSLHSEIISGAYETMMPRDCVVKNNKFINNSSDISVFTIGQVSGIADAGAITGMEISNNFFTRTQDYAVSVGSAKNCEVKHNLFMNTARKPSSKANDCVLILDNSESIAITDNYNSNDLGSSDFAGIKVRRRTLTETMALSNNVNLEYEGSGEVATAKNVAQVSGITIDGVLSDWATQGTTVDIVGASLASGVAYENYKSDFDVKMLKIGWMDNGIYLAISVKDNEVDFSEAASFWSKDCVEIFITNKFVVNGDYAVVRTMDGAATAQLGLGNWGSYAYGGRTSENMNANAWQCRYVQTSDGYDIEFYMPFTSLGTVKDSVDAGDEVGLTIVVADADRDNRVRLQVANVRHFVEENKIKTDRAARYVFVK